MLSLKKYQLTNRQKIINLKTFIRQIYLWKFGKRKPEQILLYSGFEIVRCA